MVTRYFDQPVQVEYRTHATWRMVYALAVRRCDDAYGVLIAMGPPDQEQLTAWVPRSRIRAESSLEQPA